MPPLVSRYASARSGTSAHRSALTSRKTVPNRNTHRGGVPAAEVSVSGRCCTPPTKTHLVLPTKAAHLDTRCSAQPPDRAPRAGWQLAESGRSVSAANRATRVSAGHSRVGFALAGTLPVMLSLVETLLVGLPLAE